MRITLVAWLLAHALFVGLAEARLWTDSTGHYTIEADLIAFDGKSVVLQRDDHELVFIPIEKLSDQDREYVTSQEAVDAVQRIGQAVQNWTLRDGMAISGRVVDYASRDLSVQRRRGNIYVNDRRFTNLPEFYQQLVPRIVAHFENLRRSDLSALESWLVRQRGQERTFHVEGVVLEAENGDEYTVPFFLFSDDDLSLLKPGWDEWLAQHDDHNYEMREGQAFLLRSLAAAHQRDAKVRREIAMLDLTLQAVQAGVTSLWEVTLYPGPGQGGPPRWVVSPGRDSRQATASALGRFPGYVAGPVRRISRI